MIREVPIRRIPALTNKKENLETATRARNFINSPLLIEHKRRYLEFLEWNFWAQSEESRTRKEAA
jgi:hypothetical protein